MMSARGTLVTALAATLVLVALISLNDWADGIERRATAREHEAGALAEQARELTALTAAVAELRRTVVGGEPAAVVAERVAGAEGLAVASSQGAGEQRIGTFTEPRSILRFTATTLGPLKRMLARFETAQPGLLVHELTIRRSVSRADRLDVEMVAGQISPQSSPAPNTPGN